MHYLCGPYNGSRLSLLRRYVRSIFTSSSLTYLHIYTTLTPIHSSHTHSHTHSLTHTHQHIRGGKKTDFEGGIRVNSFVGGGFVPQSARGQTRSGYMHCADWYPTLCALGGGHDCRDTNTSLARAVPAVDGYDMWRYIVGEEEDSPRQEVMVARCEHPNQHKIPNSTYPCSGAYIHGDYKIITGIQYYGFWQGPRYPNATTNHSTFDHFVDCGSGCLFNIQDDPSEYNDLRSTHPDILNDMRARLLAHNATQFDAPRAPKSGRECDAYRDAHHGYLGPYLVPTPPPPTPRGPFSLVHSAHNVEHCVSSALHLVSCANRSASSVWYVGEDGPNEAALLTGNGSCLKIHETPGQKCTWPIAYVGICNRGPSILNSFSLVNGTLSSFQCGGRCVLSPQNEGVVDSLGDQGQLSLGSCTETRAIGWSLR